MAAPLGAASRHGAAQPAPVRAAADAAQPGAARRPASPPPARVAHARVTPYLFLLPYLLIFGVFGLLPIVLGIWLSLHQWDFQLPNKPFVGIDNYKELFT